MFAFSYMHRPEEYMFKMINLSVCKILYMQFHKPKFYSEIIIARKRQIVSEYCGKRFIFLSFTPFFYFLRKITLLWLLLPY